MSANNAYIKYGNCIIIKLNIKVSKVFYILSWVYILTVKFLIYSQIMIYIDGNYCGSSLYCHSCVREDI